MASALKVPEKSAKRLLKELNITGAAKATPKKLASMLTEARESLNGDSIEDMELSNPSKSLLVEVVEAIDEERDLKIVSADVEDEADDEEEETPKKKSKGKAVKTKTQKVKTQKKGAKPAKKSSGSSKYDPEKAAVYQEKLKKEGKRIEKAIESGPKSIATIAEKAGVTESRVNSFMNYYNRNRKTPVYEVVKGRVRKND